jgi:hypothetical protein
LNKKWKITSLGWIVIVSVCMGSIIREAFCYIVGFQYNFITSKFSVINFIIDMLLTTVCFIIAYLITSLINSKGYEQK